MFFSPFSPHASLEIVTTTPLGVNSRLRRPPLRHLTSALSAIYFPALITFSISLLIVESSPKPTETYLTIPSLSTR